METPAVTLEEQRIRAAEASGGTSSDSIYRSIENIIASLALSGDVLDYGAGIGELTARLDRLNRFSRICGADIMARPKDLPSYIEWVSMDLNAALPVASSQYDVIIAAEVIEHLENPRLVAREMFRLLRPGGTLLLSTPNNESYRALVSLVVRGHFVMFTDTSYPAHITALVRKDLQRILTEAGFSSVRFQFTNKGGFPGYPSVSWQRLSLGAFKGLRFSDNLIALATK